MVLKVSLCYIYNVNNSTWLDWFWAPYILNHFESELFYWGGPSVKNVSVVDTQNKCYIFKIGEQSLQIADPNNTLGGKMSGT